MPGLTITAYAKVNLALSVGPPVTGDGPNAGYHPICTWIHAIDLADTVRLEELPPGSNAAVRVAWADGSAVGWPIKDDLASRALNALERETGHSLSCSIAVEKHIPDGAGLGGGSSNAAAVLTGVDRLFGLGLGTDTLHRLGASLGSDIPFFLDTETSGPPRPAIVSGFGERIDRIDRSVGELTLVFPGYRCPTGAVYRAYDQAPCPLREQEIADAASAALRSEQLFNDLTEPACRLEPRLGADRARLIAGLGVPAHVSGSGSTMFVLGVTTAEVAAHAPADARVRVARLV